MTPLLLLLLTAWPASTDGLTLLPLPPVRDAGRTPKLRVYVDAGHGAKDNHGAVSCICEHEEDFTARTAAALAKALAATGRFEVKLSRSGEARPSYAARVAEAMKWKADLIVGIHFDVRGSAITWEPEPGKPCWRAPLLQTPGEETNGFSVLWSDEDQTTRPERQAGARIGREISKSMAAAGFEPYGGWDYQGLYVADEVPGCFIARRKVWMLKKPTIPSLIIETHHALDLQERARWDEARTLEVFAAAVAAALLR